MRNMFIARYEWEWHDKGDFVVHSDGRLAKYYNIWDWVMYDILTETKLFVLAPQGLQQLSGPPWMTEEMHSSRKDFSNKNMYIWDPLTGIVRHSHECKNCYGEWVVKDNWWTTECDCVFSASGGGSKEWE